MQTFTTAKNFLTASLAFFIIACNDSSKKNKDKKDNPADTALTEAPALPPATDPPGVKMKKADKKCFANEGLKYKTLVTMNLGGNEVVGNVTSEELESGKKETVNFEGTVSGIQLTIKFKGTPPAIGAASEWTEKPWRIDQVAGESKGKLHIVFKAKNYDTNKWEDTVYEFVSFDCK